jgi:hypothetical protein
MRSHHTLRFALSLVGFLVVAAIARAQAQPALSELEIADKARIAILGLPYYGVFDLLAFEVHGNTVTLGGDVYRAALKNEAEEAVKKIPGVTRVINKIEVLPVSIDGDRIRMELFRKIYTDDFLSKYGTPVAGLDGLRFGRRYWGRGFGACPASGRARGGALRFSAWSLSETTESTSSSSR